MGNVGNAGEEVLKFVVEGFDLVVEGGHFPGHGANLGLPLGGVGALAAQAGDLRAFGIAARLQLFGPGDGGTAVAVELAKAVEVRRISASRQPLCNALEIGPEMREIVHDPPC